MPLVCVLGLHPPLCYCPPPSCLSRSSYSPELLLLGPCSLIPSHRLRFLLSLMQPLGSPHLGLTELQGITD